MKLQGIGFEDGCFTAKDGMNEFPELGMNELGLTKLREQLVYLEAYHQGYMRWEFTYSCTPSPYEEGEFCS